MCPIGHMDICPNPIGDPIGHIQLINYSVTMIISFFFYFDFDFIFFLLENMPPPKHSYTKYITVLNEKANKFNYFALCCYCKAKLQTQKG